MKAYCMSEACLKAAGKYSSNSSGVFKAVDRSVVQCPQCKYLLVWKKDGKPIRHFGTSPNRKKKLEESFGYNRK